MDSRAPQEREALISELGEMRLEYEKEVLRCFNIAQRLDAMNPELPGAFTGTPSERIRRQLASVYGVVLGDA